MPDASAPGVRGAVLGPAGTATPTEADELREVIAKLANHEWIIGTAYNGRDFGWQVNVRDGEPKGGTQHYTAWRETFAASPADAGLNGVRAALTRLGGGTR